MDDKKLGKSYNAANARHVNFPNFQGMGAPMITGRHWWYQKGCEWVAKSRLYKALGYLLRFCRSFEVKFWFPQFGRIGALI